MPLLYLCSACEPNELLYNILSNSVLEKIVSNCLEENLDVRQRSVAFCLFTKWMLKMCLKFIDSTEMTNNLPIAYTYWNSIARHCSTHWARICSVRKPAFGCIAEKPSLSVESKFCSFVAKHWFFFTVKPSTGQTLKSNFCHTVKPILLSQLFALHGNPLLPPNEAHLNMR